MSDFRIDIRDPELAAQGWRGLTRTEERRFLYELLDSIREANEQGTAQPVEEIIEIWWRHGVLAKAGTPEERRARGEEVRRSGVTMTVDEFAEWLEREAEKVQSTTTTP